MFPRPWERVRVRGLTERDQSEILRSSSSDLLQSNCLSLRMTNALDNSNKCRHPEQSEGSFTDSVWINPSPQSSPQGEEVWREDCHAEHIGKFPSPREEGAGERVQLEEKINPSPQSSPQGEEAVGRVQGAIREKCAFTLAEVLITLGIIGVVAAMTIPTLMANVKAHQYSAKFKKTVSTLSNAAKMSQAQYGFDYSGLTDKCNAKSGTDNPEDKQSLCSLLNGTLTGATYYYGMDNFPNYEIKESATFDSVDSLVNAKNKIPIYQLSDGSLILFSSLLGGNHSKTR